MSQTTVLSNSHYNLRVTYDITSTQVIFYKIEGMSTDGYESYGNNSTLYLNSSAMMTGTVRFPGNSYYTIWNSSGGWGTSEFAGFFYATSCGEASNLKFWYEFSKPSTKYTLTLKTTTGVASFTGGGTYNSGTSVATTAKSSTGYKLTKYVGTNNDGGTSTWTGCAGLTTHNDTWTLNRDRTITVYATPNTYTVTYNANGGSGSMASSTATYNAGFTTRQNTFTKSGYKFAGWNEAADGSGTSWTLSSVGVYESGKGAWKWTYTKNITLYAQWLPADKYTVTYDANGGYSTKGGASVWSNSATYGSTYTVVKNEYSDGTQWYAKNGYDFAGWSRDTTSKNGSNWASLTQSTVGSNYVTGKNGVGNTVYYWTGTWSGSWASSDIYLYASWKPVTVKVTFDKNDGTGKTYSESYTAGNSNSFGMNLESKTGQFGLWDRTGYKLLGWSTSKTATSATWQVYASVTDDWIEKNRNGVTLYAVWQINKYTISFNGNGGTGVPSNQTKTYGTNLVLSTVVPKKEATSSNGYTIKYELEGGTLSKDSDTSLKITSYTFNKWKDLSGTLYASGGTYTKNQNDTLTAQWNTSVSYSSITLPEASRPNCKLLGWSTSAGGNVVYTAGQSITPSSNMALYAVWEGRSVLYKNNGVWVEGLVYVKENGAWKFGKMYTKQNDSWISN